jgi:hypothetical protein
MLKNQKRIVEKRKTLNKRRIYSENEQYLRLNPLQVQNLLSHLQSHHHLRVIHLHQKKSRNQLNKTYLRKEKRKSKKRTSSRQSLKKSETNFKRPSNNQTVNLSKNKNCIKTLKNYPKKKKIYHPNLNK